MTTNTYLPTIEYKMQKNKQNRNRLKNTKNILTAVRWEVGLGGWVKKVKGIKK